jgi:hypothetical protein
MINKNEYITNFALQKSGQVGESDFDRFINLLKE